MQVPLGTVVHKVAPDVEPEEEDTGPFTFQQHWVGARDYVSSDEESADVDSANKPKPDSTQANLEVTNSNLQSSLQFVPSSTVLAQDSRAEERTPCVA